MLLLANELHFPTAATLCLSGGPLWVISGSEDRLDGLPLTWPQHPSKRTQCCTAAYLRLWANCGHGTPACRGAQFPSNRSRDRLSTEEA